MQKMHLKHKEFFQIRLAITFDKKECRVSTTTNKIPLLQFSGTPLDKLMQSEAVKEKAHIIRVS